MKKIDIVFSFDAHYYRQAIVAISSLLNCNQDVGYNIYCVIKKDVTLKKQKEIISVVRLYSKSSNVFFIQDTPVFEAAYECRGITVSAYSRLMLHRLLPLDKVIYSDVDVLFLKDLREVDAIDISPYFYAGVRDIVLNTKEIRALHEKKYPYWKTQMGVVGNNYHNSGFLVLNLKKWREVQLDAQIIELSRYPYLFQDQDILNLLFAERQEEILTLSPKWIYMPKHNYKRALEENIISAQDYEDIQKRPAILHYSGRKPWDDPGVVRAKDWWDYVRENTPPVL